MKPLIEYFNTNIRLTDIDGKQWPGYVETYTPAIDSEVEIEEVGVMTQQGLISFRADEIAEITEE